MTAILSRNHFSIMNIQHIFTGSRPILSIGLALALMTGPVMADYKEPFPTKSQGYSRDRSNTGGNANTHNPPPTGNSNSTNSGYTRDHTPAGNPPPVAGNPPGTNSGYTRDHTPAGNPPPVAGNPPGTNLGYTRDQHIPAGNPPPAAGNPPPVARDNNPPAGQSIHRSPVDLMIAQGQSKAALDKYNADKAREQQKFKAAAVAAPTTAEAAQQSPVWTQYGRDRKWGSYNDYANQRAAAEARLPPRFREYYDNPPAYVLRGPPSFGGIATPFLVGALAGVGTSIVYDRFFHSHWNDPGIRAWHQYMQEQAEDESLSETDRDLLNSRLALLDRRMAQLEADHTPITTALPEGIDPALIVAPDTVALATSGGSHVLRYVITILVSLVLLAVMFGVLAIWISRRRRLASL